MMIKFSDQILLDIINANMNKPRELFRELNVVASIVPWNATGVDIGKMNVSRCWLAI